MSARLCYWTRPMRPLKAHTIRLMIDKVERETGVPRRILVGPGRGCPGQSTARQELMYLLAANTDLPLAHIGRHIGGRHHTTIMHGIDQHCKRNQLEPPR